MKPPRRSNRSALRHLRAPTPARPFARWATLLGFSLLHGMAPDGARAVETERFELDSEEELTGGVLAGSAVDSSGQVIAGVATERLPIEDASMARAVLTVRGGETYVGTGTKGAIYRFKDGKLTPFAETGALMVTCLAEGPEGTLFAGTTPKGEIVRVDRAGKVESLPPLPGADHVWSLAYDRKHNRLFAATGPEGKIFTIAPDGAAEVYLDTEAEHVMVLALSEQGRLFAGTTDEALLLEVTGRDQARVIYDFDGNEITAVAVAGDTLAVGENLFPKSGTKKPGVAKAKAKAKANGAGHSNGKAGSNGNRPAKPGKGQLWRVQADGRARHLFEMPSGHITAVAFDGDAILAAAGAEGQVYRVRRDGTYALWVDADERQVLALSVRKGVTRFVTGDGAALYRTVPLEGQPAQWTSKSLDAEFQARFGQLDFRGTGRFKLQTRSGNTEKPDGSWSEWSSSLTRPGPIRSPAGRFLQVRATLEADAVLYAVTAYYLPRNQVPVVRSIKVTPVPSKGESKGASRPSSVYEVRWDADSVDGDTLRYRLFYRPESAKRERPMLRDHVRWTRTKYRWNTDSVPDGYYVIRVSASDEMSNGEGRAEGYSTLSEPFLVDNHPPHIEGLRAIGRRVSGQAIDRMGPITSLEYKLDSEPWKPLLPLDDLLDTAQERFVFTLPEGLAPGVHVVAVRARDARHNLGSAELEVLIGASSREQRR